MLHRFVARELLETHPHDPETTFGRKLFLFSDTLCPHVAAYVDDPHPLLRRNAVAALGRYRTSEAVATLVRLAVESDDPVVRARALSAIARHRFAVPVDGLCAKLERTVDRADAVALVHTLGCVGHEPAVPALLAHAKKHSTDSDVVLATALALARIPTAEHAAAAREWLVRMLRTADANPSAFMPEGPRFPVSADIPDPPDMRARMIGQLAAIAIARVDPSDAHAARVLRLAGEESKSARLGPLRGMYSNGSLGSVLPVAQPVFLEVLAVLGPKGSELLQRVARDPDTDPVLRAQALSALLGPEGPAIAEEILALDRDPVPLRIHALELLARDGSARLEDLARKAAAEKPGADPSLQLAGLTALGRAAKLPTDEIAARLDRLARKRGPDEPFEVTIRKGVEDLVEAYAASTSRSQVVKKIDQLLDLVIAAGLNPRIFAATKNQARIYVQGQLLAVRARKADAAYLKLVVAAVQNYLLGTVVTSLEQKLEFLPYVPLEESLILMLGRAGDADAITALAQRLRDRADPYRATVCLALGSTGKREAARHLVPLLLDGEPFVRFCAWLSLQNLTGQSFFADWWAGTRTDQAAAADRYARWLATSR
jgi:HEAT repeat protein